MEKEEDMKNKRKLKKFCTEFVVLDEVEKDYIIGISQALAFAIKKPGQMMKALSQSRVCVLHEDDAKKEGV
jgi:hypothetical protein